MTHFKTIPEMMSYVVGNFHNPRAFNEKIDDKWLHWSTEEIIRTARNLAIGLSESGLRKGEAVGLLAPSSPMWLIMDLAIVMAGGITVPVFSNISSKNLSYIVEDSGMQYIFIQGSEALADVQEIKEKFDLIIQYDTNEVNWNMTHWKDIHEKGYQKSLADAGAFNQITNKITTTDIATYIYTSGSTGLPKGVELTHGNLMSQVNGAGEVFDVNASADLVLSCLPLAHIFEKMVVYFYISKGLSIYFADDIKKLGSLLQEVKPTLLTVVPRLLEKVKVSIQEKAQNGGLIKKVISNFAFSRASNKDPNSESGILDSMCNKLVYKKIKKALGGEIKTIISGGSALSKDLCTWYSNMGIPVFQGYGMTECSPVIAVNCKKNNRIGSVGKLFPDVEVQISERGEICVKGPGIMKGYHNNPDETHKTIDKGGWLSTGDKGMLDDDGYLFITGRIKEIFKTSNGKYVSPSQIENLLTEDITIEVSMIIGENRKFVSCLLFISPETIENYIKKKGQDGLSPEEFVRSKNFISHIDSHIEKVNSELNHWEQIRKHNIIYGIPTVDDGGLTPTLKIRRHILNERYEKIIEEMYEE
ncbi:MAG: long-chain fatty acid--CoA ligase [Planctomycetota bacterium]|nr:MAG: long-chain fatty acid--CoA ligase [Planctomycetota bacterium]